MSLTIDNKVPLSLGNRDGIICDVAYDSSYVKGGELLTPTMLGFANRIDFLSATGKDGVRFEYDYSGEKLRALDKPWAETTLAITDLDAAAATGVGIYVHVDEILEDGSALAHLEAVSPTNADITLTAYNGGPTVYIRDDDNAATNGVLLYFDEDGTLGSRLLANTGHDCYVNIGGGRFIKITHNATPGTPGVQVYVDEDAANSYEKLLFVSPTNASGSDTTSAEVDASISLSALDDVRVFAIGV